MIPVYLLYDEIIKDYYIKANIGVKMNDKEILYQSLVEIKKLITNKELSPVELTKMALERIEETNDKTNAFLNVYPEMAINDAKKVEQKIINGEPLGLMAGIPTSIKDLEPVKDMITTRGSLLTKDAVSDKDQIGVERIKQHDGIILGKTNVPESGSSGTTENKLGDDCRNPWNLDHTAGGSSGGTGASVASGVTPVAQGSDGGGSIRIPSSFCGIYGIKGTQGRIPRRHAGLSSWHPVNFSCMGPMSRYVIDSAIMMQVMAGPHPEAEPGTIQAAPPDFISNIEKGISGKKIAWSQDFGCRPIHPDVKTNTQRAVKVFEELGAKVEPFDFTFNLDDLEEPIMKVLGFASRYASGGDELLKKDPDAFMPHVYNTILRGKEVRSDDYVRALARLYEYRAYVESIFEEYDFITAPTMAIPANKINERAFFENGEVVSLPWNDEIKFQANDLDFSSWNYVYHAMTSLFNWSGNPAATLPCGFSTDGLPIGLQIVGKKENEVGVLQASRAYEIARPWHENKPNI